jgi:SAM-dependent methyltransferase
MDSAIESKLKAARWYHAFEVLPGVITPGVVGFDARATLDALGVPRDLRGKRALDVGTWDGPMAFELEERGAEVCAVDVQDPDCTAFNTAKDLRNSRVRYVRASVCDLGRAVAEKFDLIVYFGVYYHLKHPILGFEALSGALAAGGRLYFEGELWINYSETFTGARSGLDDRSLGQSDVPLALCYTGDYKVTSNWFVPNLTCLRGWMEAAGLEMVAYQLHDNPEQKPYPHQRIMGCAVKSPELGILDELPIFGKDLEISKAWQRRTGNLRDHRYRIAGTQPPPVAP